MPFEVGDVFSFPVTVWSADDEPAETGYFGAAQVLSESKGQWLIGALEHLDRTPLVARMTRLMNLGPVEGLRSGQHLVLARGDSLPGTFQLAGHWELDVTMLELSDAFLMWRDPASSLYESQTAYERLGGVADRVSAVEHAVAYEWRVRFELKQLLAERETQRVRALEERRAREALRTWEDVVRQRVGVGYPPVFASRLRKAWRILTTSCEQPSAPDLKQVLAAFFSSLASVKHASEYRDEITRLALDVAVRRGGSEALVLRLAEQALS